MSYLGDTPKTNFKQAQLIHWLALPEEYRDPSTESALAQKLGVNRARARVRSSRGLGVAGEGQYTSPATPNLRVNGPRPHQTPPRRPPTASARALPFASSLPSPGGRKPTLQTRTTPPRFPQPPGRTA